MGIFDTYYYRVEQIDGDYAHLRAEDSSEKDLKLVARAILPPEITEGSRIRYASMEYTIEND